MGKCPKCCSNLYKGRNNTLWHTNVPGESVGREADDVICLMTGFLRRERDTAWAECRRLRTALIECHRRACTQQNCTLDGGPEHRIAFLEAAKAKEK